MFINNTCWFSKVVCPQKLEQTRKPVFRLFVSPLLTERFWRVFFFRHYLQAPRKVQKETHILVILLLKFQNITTKRHQQWSNETSSNKPKNTSNQPNKTPLSCAERNIKNYIIKGIVKRVINDKEGSKNTICCMVITQNYLNSMNIFFHG